MNRIYPTDYSTRDFIEILACAKVFAEQQGRLHEELGKPVRDDEYRTPELQQAYLDGRKKMAEILAARAA
jgi:hypothetical protein